jgi:hypothetical protein
MSPPAPRSSPELVRYIEGAGEIQNVDAKGPMSWDGHESSAGLTKDILALANTRDGGVIVIGKSEPTPGKFAYDGLTADQADSFEVTKVASWVNSRCAPPVKIGVYRQEYQGREFVIITVSDFDDVPVICTRTFDRSADGGKRAERLLTAGAIYVRTANVASAPLSSAEDVRALFGLATVKRRDEFATLLDSMLKGRPLLPPPGVDPFARERAQVVAALEEDWPTDAAAWRFTMHPADHVPNRWEEMAQLRQLLDRAAIRIDRPFPDVNNGVHPREWGLCNDQTREPFGMTRSGLFVCSSSISEDFQAYMGSTPLGQDQEIIPAGEWLRYEEALIRLIRYFAFASRFAGQLNPSEQVTYKVTVRPLQGRRLVGKDDHPMEHAAVCRASTFEWHRQGVRVADLLAGWKEECARAAFRLFELFRRTEIGVDGLRRRIDHYLAREFGR